MKRERKNRLVVFILCLLVAYAAGFIGSIFTSGETNGEWYGQIRPSLTPPSWVFPIVWNVLYFLIAISLFYSWVKGNGKERKYVVLAFGSNLVLNALWSYLYFGLHNVKFAFYDIILIFLTIIWMMIVSYKIEKKACYLLIPYLLWVGFASILNFMSIP